MLLLLLMGCRAPAAEIAAPTPMGTAAPTPTPAPPQLPVVEAPSPPQGRATVYGQVLLGDGTAAVDYAVLLCAGFTQYAACEGRQYVTMTEVDGVYVFTDVVPGLYALVVYLDEQEVVPLQFVVDEAGQVRLFEVTAGEKKGVEPLVLFANDVKVISPLRTGRLSSETAVHKLTGELTLSWQPYPNAVAYEVYLAPARGETIFVNERVAEGKITAVLPRVNCDYYWQVAAFDAANIKIAETEGVRKFAITGEADSCELTLLSPQAGAVVSGTAEIVLDWEVHETADSYRVWLVDKQNATRPTLLDFEEVTSSKYELANGLLPSHYEWAVFAYDEQGRLIAESDVEGFEVSLVVEN
ncbi:MAG: hypothetical protein H6658_10285 [Ardenticatenaceae bacterium]|nr:hypothetical protein [Ardenticatenaceae bacterium]